MNLLVFQHPAALPLNQLERPLAGRPQVFLDLVLHLVQLVLQAQELHLLKRPVRSLGGALTHLGPSRAEIVFESAESRDHGPVRILQPDQVSLAIGGAGPLLAPRAPGARGRGTAGETASLPPWPHPGTWRPPCDWPPADRGGPTAGARKTPPPRGRAGPPRRT